MKILVYGAGPLGSVFAARLQQGGHDVAILARGQRLADLREHGIILENVVTGERTVTRVDVVAELASDDAYDLVLVVMRKNHALAILPVLKANAHTPTILFLMNNAAGPGALVEALGRARVMIGFPGVAGYREDPVVHALVGTEDKEATVYLGEVDGSITERTVAVAEALGQAPGFRPEIRTDMDAWLKYHVALLMPSLGPALYMCGTDRMRLVRTRDALVLAVRAVREGFRVLQALGVPVTPAKFKVFLWLPEPLLVLMLRRAFANALMEVAMVRHAEAARDEVKHLTDEFMALARTTDVPTPNIHRLYPHLDPATPLMPEGRAKIPMDWRGVWLAVGALAVVVGAVWVVGRAVKKSTA